VVIVVIVVVVVVVIMIVIMVVLVARLDIDRAFVCDASRSQSQGEKQKSGAKRDDGHAKRLVHELSSATRVPPSRDARCLLIERQRY
jgi:uncharacterized membrane protein YqiK